jgi:spore germination protein
MTDLLVAHNLPATLDNIRAFLGNPADLRILFPDEEHALAVIYQKGTIDEKELLARLDDFLKKPDHPTSIKRYFREKRELEVALADLNQGHAIFLEQQGPECFTYNFPLPGWQLRAIEEPLSERMIRGPREGFTESINANTAMIRRWISDQNFHIEALTVGAKTQTAIRLLYLADVAAPGLIAEVRSRIAAIEIDGILESGYLEQLITDNPMTIFPLIQSTERTDKVAAAVLEGRVAILVDKSPFALIVPTTINELYQSPEDYYFNFYLGSFLRFFRLFGNLMAIALPGLYIALAYVNPELLPVQFLIWIANSRIGVPYPIYIEVLILEVFEEIFREAGLRLSGTISQILGTAIGLSLTFAAIQTHLVSGSSLVVSAVSAAALFSTPNYSIGVPWRIFKFVLMIGATFLGVVGVTLSGLFILAHAATLTSFGVSYLAPWAPLQATELADDSVFRIPMWWRRQRPGTYNPVNRYRLGKFKQPGKKNN